MKHNLNKHSCIGKKVSMLCLLISAGHALENHEKEGTHDPRYNQKTSELRHKFRVSNQKASKESKEQSSWGPGRRMVRRDSQGPSPVPPGFPADSAPHKLHALNSSQHLCPNIHSW